MVTQQILRQQTRDRYLQSQLRSRTLQRLAEERRRQSQVQEIPQPQIQEQEAQQQELNQQVERIEAIKQEIVKERDRIRQQAADITPTDQGSKDFKRALSEGANQLNHEVAAYDYAINKMKSEGVILDIESVKEYAYKTRKGEETRQILQQRMQKLAPKIEEAKKERAAYLKELREKGAKFVVSQTGEIRILEMPKKITTEEIKAERVGGVTSSVRFLGKDLGEEWRRRKEVPTKEAIRQAELKSLALRQYEQRTGFKELFKKGELPSAARQFAREVGAKYFKFVSGAERKLRGKEPLTKEQIQSGGTLIGETALFSGLLTPVSPSTTAVQKGLTQQAKIKFISFAQRKEGGVIKSDVVFESQIGKKIRVGEARGLSKIVDVGKRGFKSKTVVVGRTGTEGYSFLKGRVIFKPTQKFAGLERGAGLRLKERISIQVGKGAVAELKGTKPKGVTKFISQGLQITGKGKRLTFSIARAETPKGEAISRGLTFLRKAKPRLPEKPIIIQKGITPREPKGIFFYKEPPIPPQREAVAQIQQVSIPKPQEFKAATLGVQAIVKAQATKEIPQIIIGKPVSALIMGKSLFKIKEKVKPSERVGVLPIQLPKEKEIQIQQPKTIQIMKTKQIPKLKQPQILIQPPKQLEIQKAIPILQQVQKQIPQQKAPQRVTPRLILKTPQIPRTRPPILPRTPTPTTFAFTPQQKERILEVFTKRFGKEVSLGFAPTERAAKEKLKKTLIGTLAASGVIKEAGKKIKFDLGMGFEPSKKEFGRIIQKRELRLSARPEVKEIQFFASKSSKQKKRRKFSFL